MKAFRFAAVVLCALPAAAFAQDLIEDFPDPLSDYYNGWLGSNSNLISYYLANGNNDLDYRGNNNDGIWIHDGQGNDNCDILFDPSLGNDLVSLSLDFQFFVSTDIDFYDMDDNIFYSVQGLTGAQTVTTTDSNNGISRMYVHSQSQVEGNTDLNQVRAWLVPAPGSAALLTLGGLAMARRRR